MWLEDYRDAIAFTGKIPSPNKWIDELRYREDDASIRAMLRW